MSLHPFERNQLQQLMSWFPDKASCRTWGGPEFRYPFDELTFQEDSRIQDLPSWSLAGSDGSLSAFGQYYLRAGRCHLSRLAVAPQLRGQGIGSALVRELCQRGCEALAVTSCSLFVLPGNESALRLYQRLGFVAVPYPEPDPVFAECIYMVASRSDPGDDSDVLLTSSC